MSKIPMVTLKLKLVCSSPRFQHFYSALQYLQHNNPARQIYIDTLNTDGIPQKERKPSVPLSGDHPHDQWSMVCLAFNKHLKAVTKEQRVAFQLSYLMDREVAPSQKEIAQHLRVSQQTVSRWLAEMRKDIEKSLKGYNLLKDEDEN